MFGRLWNRIADWVLRDLTFPAATDDGERSGAVNELSAEGDGHRWIRTIPTDGMWCELCGEAMARWSGTPCSGEGAARRIERRLANRTATLARELAEARERLARVEALAREWDGKHVRDGIDTATEVELACRDQVLSALHALAGDREGSSLRQIARERGIKPVGTDLDIETGKRVDDREGGEQ